MGHHSHNHCCAHDHSPATDNHGHGHSHDHDHDHGSEGSNGWLAHWDLLTALLILAVMMVLRFAADYIPATLIDFSIHAVAFVLAGWRVVDLAFRKLKRGDIFNEFFLMTVATMGAFYIGSYSEGVAVMVFYCIGEWFQDAAVANARKSIKALLDIRPDQVTVLRNGNAETTSPSAVVVGEVIQVKPGEKVALDGRLLTANASFNTAALTGESKPDTKHEGDTILAGMINGNTPVTIEVTTLFTDSKLSRILSMVQDAAARKSQTQLFISRFARMYTPAVFILAAGVCLLPALVVKDYQFTQWLYRALVFLVVSCPCALVVSIPLGYFGGIGLASRNGILFKGGNFLDVMTKIDTVVMDKTGTLTKGVFSVQQVYVSEGFNRQQLLKVAAALEQHSTHPVAKAITAAAGTDPLPAATAVEEIAGHGMTGTVNGETVLAGNEKLMQRYGIAYPTADVSQTADTVVIIATGNRYAGYITIADELKEDAQQAIQALQAAGIATIMLSGDKQSVVTQTAEKLGITEAYGDLLPEDKVNKVQQLKQAGHHLAFAGDGVNDAPVIALADAGIAMGGLGSDAAIETADIVIQNDQPLKIAAAVKIGKITRRIVWQNIVLAMAVKVLVLILGAGGLATLWEAVIADVGVALLAIVNAIRIQQARL